MSEENFCKKCEAYNKHILQPANLPLRNTFYSDMFCPNCAREKKVSSWRDYWLHRWDKLEKGKGNK